MSWMRKLYDTYEHAQGLSVDNDKVLMPISHTLQNAHINIVIDKDGSFLRAKVLEKAQIILPATESSAGRSSGEAPHPLADKLQYVAKDYSSYGGIKKNYFEGYLKQLTEWVSSDYSHPSVAAVCAYVAKGTVIADLIKSQVCHIDTNSVLLTTWSGDIDLPPLLKTLPREKGTFDQGNAMVCWSVEIPGKDLSDTWEDEAIQQAWVDFDIHRGGESSLCLVSGQEMQVASNHPAKLRHSGDKAKLISANDSSGYTFRGRFTSSDQAAEVGFEVTQKAHNALRWLISRQGYSNGDQVILSWAVSGRDIPQPFSDPDSWDDEVETVSNELAEETIDHSTDLGASFASVFSQKLQGYRSGQKLAVTDEIVVMALDSATPGRMAISYYRDFNPQEYLNNLEQWHLDFAWWQRASKAKQDEGKRPWFIAAPSLWAILQAVYGDIIKSNESLKKNLIERLLPAIIEKRPVPKDIVQRAFHRATSRQSFKQDEQWQWEQNLGVTCSLIRGEVRRKNERRVDMALDTETCSRDYLFGRLLAIAERIEEVALSASGSNRPTAAQRLMQRFSDRPYDTWLIIYKQLEPYVRQLKQRRAGFLTNMSKELDQVMSKFVTEDYKSPNSLSPEFLLGFHCQRLALHQKKVATETEETIEEGTEA